MFHDLRNSLGDDDAVLGQQAADLIDQHGALLNEPAAQSVEGLDILTLHRLERDEAQVRACDGFTNCRRIAAVILIPFA